MIEQIYVNNKGEFVLAPMLGDHIILFGYYKDAEEKLRKLKIFYKEVLPYEGWRKYDTIDLRFRGQVIGR
jgi:cell division protein FtsQ